MMELFNNTVGQLETLGPLALVGVAIAAILGVLPSVAVVRLVLVNYLRAFLRAAFGKRKPKQLTETAAKTIEQLEWRLNDFEHEFATFKHKAEAFMSDADGHEEGWSDSFDVLRTRVQELEKRSAADALADIEGRRRLEALESLQGAWRIEDRVSELARTEVIDAKAREALEIHRKRLDAFEEDTESKADALADIEDFDNRLRLLETTGAGEEVSQRLHNIEGRLADLESPLAPAWYKKARSAADVLEGFGDRLKNLEDRYAADARELRNYVQKCAETVGDEMKGCIDELKGRYEQLSEDAFKPSKPGERLSIKDRIESLIDEIDRLAKT